jgi:hypothetical protein
VNATPDQMGVVFLDTSEIDDDADYGGLLHELKKLNIRDGQEFQIEGNGRGIFMHQQAFERCRHVLATFRVEQV